jgi:hypothetical protein
MLDWMLPKRPVVLNNCNTTAGKRLKTTVKIAFLHRIPMPHFPVRNDVNVCLQITTLQHCASCYIIQIHTVMAHPQNDMSVL